jgi:hypothetical protein
MSGLGHIRSAGNISHQSKGGSGCGSYTQACFSQQLLANFCIQGMETFGRCVVCGQDGHPEHARSVNEQVRAQHPLRARNVAFSNSIHLAAAPPDILYIRGLARVQGSESGVAGSGAGGHQ